MEYFIYSAAILILIFWSGYFSSTETAFFSISSLKIKAYNDSQDKRKKLIAKLLHRPRELLVTVFMLNTLVNILLQNVTSNMVGVDAGWTLKVGVPFILTLIFGEIIPKNFGLEKNEFLAYHSTNTINFFQKTLKPIRKFIVSVTAPISRVLFFFLRQDQSISKDELRHVLRTSEKHGILDPDEAKLVWGYLNLQDTMIKEVMRHKDDILFYELKEPLTKLTHLFMEQEVSRLPVCKGDINGVLGIISANDYLIHRPKLINSEHLKPILSKPFYVPETIHARLLLRQFNEKKQEIAMVVDEYGNITGLVTHEDLVEVVVGKISDKRDLKPLYTRSGKGEIIASGKLELNELNELFGTQLESKYNVVTVGGWLTEKIGNIPKSGTKYEIEGLLIQVLASDLNRIRRLYIRMLPSGEKS